MRYASREVAAAGVMDILKDILGWVWRAQLRPSFVILSGIVLAVSVFEWSERSTLVIALYLLIGLFGGLWLIWHWSRKFPGEH